MANGSKKTSPTKRKKSTGEGNANGSNELPPNKVSRSAQDQDSSLIYHELHEGWKVKEAAAEALVPQIGKLYKENNVLITFFGRRLNTKSAIDIIKDVEWANTTLGMDVSIKEILNVVEALTACATFFTISWLRFDAGKTVVELKAELKPNTSTHSVSSWGSEQLVELQRRLFSKIEKAKLTSPSTSSSTDAKPSSNCKDVVLYGFGRIGRLVARLLIERAGTGSKLMLRAIVVRKKKKPDLHKRLSLLLRDSVHGKFNAFLAADEERNAIVANGILIKILYANSPSEIDYTQHGIHDAIVVDNTGIWRDKKGLNLHLKAKGVAKVLLTAPATGGIPNVVFGVNSADLDGNDIVSAASCTTNAVVPVLKTMNEHFGLQSGHLETIHSYTNDQNLVDNYHKKDRRGRAATINMVLTNTGAASAVGVVCPELKGLLTASAIRVPTPNVSMAILMLELKKDASREEVNEVFRQIASGQSSSGMQKQIDFSTSNEVCSSDMVGSRHACIIDSPKTICSGKRCNLYVWYDNEFGYSCQVVRCIQRMSGIKFARFPQ